METRKFNEAAGRFGKDIAILTISMDPPFAQKRWCAAAGENQGPDAIGSPGGFFWKFLRGFDQEAQIARKSGFLIDRKGVIQMFSS